MNKRLYFVLCVLISVVIFSPGCQKDAAQNLIITPTKTELLTRSAWIFLSASAGGTDVTSNSLLTCFKDNIITFTANGSFTVNESAVVCNPSTAGNFTWNFQSGESQLVLSVPLIPGGSGTFTLTSLTESNLVISQNATIPPATTPILVVFTFKH